MVGFDDMKWRWLVDSLQLDEAKVDAIHAELKTAMIGSGYEEDLASINFTIKQVLNFEDVNETREQRRFYTKVLEIVDWSGLLLLSRVAHKLGAEIYNLSCTADFAAYCDIFWPDRYEASDDDAENMFRLYQEPPFDLPDQQVLECIYDPVNAAVKYTTVTFEDNPKPTHQTGHSLKQIKFTNLYTVMKECWG